MTCASSHGFMLATTMSLQFCRKHIGLNRNLKVSLWGDLETCHLADVANGDFVKEMAQY
jgi:hypothetical protein